MSALLKKFSDEYTLADGRKITCNPSTSVGASVLLSDGTPLEDGEFTLSDKLTITILSGVITEVESTKEEAQEDAVGDVNPDETTMSKVEFSAEVETTNLKNEITSLKENINALQTTLNGLVKNFAAQGKELASYKEFASESLDIIKTISEKTTEASIEKKVPQFGYFTEMEVARKREQERIEQITATLQEIRNKK